MPGISDLITQKYLTLEAAILSVDFALNAIVSGNGDIAGPISHLLKRQHCHVVILVPGMKDDRAEDYPDWPNYPLQPVLLYEDSCGNPNEWEHPYDAIARCKALQLWTDRNDDKHGVIPHLLFPGDTPYWGRVKRDGIVVACSGVQPWFDRLIAGIIADTLIALAHHAFENDPERQDVDFLK